MFMEQCRHKKNQLVDIKCMLEVGVLLWHNAHTNIEAANTNYCKT
jgi:hypothetical protein